MIYDFSFEVFDRPTTDKSLIRSQFLKENNFSNDTIFVIHFAVQKSLEHLLTIFESLDQLNQELIFIFKKIDNQHWFEMEFQSLSLQNISYSFSESFPDSYGDIFLNFDRSSNCIFDLFDSIESRLQVISVSSEIINEINQTLFLFEDVDQIPGLFSESIRVILSPYRKPQSINDLRRETVEILTQTFL